MNEDKGYGRKCYNQLLISGEGPKSSANEELTLCLCSSLFIFFFLVL